MTNGIVRAIRIEEIMNNIWQIKLKRIKSENKIYFHRSNKAEPIRPDIILIILTIVFIH